MPRTWMYFSQEEHDYRERSNFCCKVVHDHETYAGLKRQLKHQEKILVNSRKKLSERNIHKV
jgi:hypothetical protein